MNKFQHKSNLLGTFAGGEIPPVNDVPIIGNTGENNLSENKDQLINIPNEVSLNDNLVSEQNIDDNIIDNVDEITKEANPENQKEPILKKAEKLLTENRNWSDDEPTKFWVFNFVNKSERTIFLAFILPPIVISIISMLHSITFFELTNSLLLSWSLAAAFEFASISALFALTALSKIKKTTIWILFGCILLIQIVGNMYHSIVHLDINNPDLLKLLSVIGINIEFLPWVFRILAFLQGGILPIISLSFVKATVEYLSFNRTKDNI